MKNEPSGADHLLPGSAGSAPAGFGSSLSAAAQAAAAAVAMFGNGGAQVPHDIGSLGANLSTLGANPHQVAQWLLQQQAQQQQQQQQQQQDHSPPSNDEPMDRESSPHSSGGGGPGSDYQAL